MRFQSIVLVATAIGLVVAAPALQREEKRGFVTDDLDARSFVTEDRREFITEPEKRAF
ncbi:cell surface protein precursor, partial [Colletotrichum sojae]